MSIKTPDLASSHLRATTEKRRREILDAALKCFLQKGVSETTIKQIQIESGASSGSIYHLFHSKDEIALILFIEGMTDYQAKLEQALREEDSAQGCVRAIITMHLKNVAGNPARAAYLTCMGIGDNPGGDISDQYQTLVDGFAEAVWLYLEPYVGRGEIVRLPKGLYFSLIIGPTAFLCRSWLRDPVGSDLMASSGHLVDAAWKSLQA